MWWRMQQTYATTMTQTMTKATTTTWIMKTPLPIKLKEYPSYPHTSGRMGATARDCPIGVEVFLLLLLLLLLHA